MGIIRSRFSFHSSSRFEFKISQYIGEILIGIVDCVWSAKISNLKNVWILFEFE